MADKTRDACWVGGGVTLTLFLVRRHMQALVSSAAKLILFEVRRPSSRMQLFACVPEDDQVASARRSSRLLDHHPPFLGMGEE